MYFAKGWCFYCQTKQVHYILQFILDIKEAMMTAINRTNRNCSSILIMTTLSIYAVIIFPIIAKFNPKTYLGNAKLFDAVEIFCEIKSVKYVYRNRTFLGSETSCLITKRLKTCQKYIWFTF